MRFCRGCASPYRLKGYSANRQITQSNDAPSGSVVVPSGKRGPLYCAIYSQSPNCASLTLTRLQGTPSRAAVSAWPTAETNRPLAMVRSGLAHDSNLTRGRSAASTMLRENALAMNVAMIDLSSPLGVCVLLPR